MNPGLLDCRVEIQRATTAIGRFGAPNDTWAPWKTRWARKKESTGNENTSNGREIGDQITVFTIRYTVGITLKDRLVFKSKVYDILSIVEIGRRHYQELNCRAHSDTPAR